MKSRILILKNRLGIHARSSVLFASTVSQYDAEVIVESSGHKVSGKSFLGMLSLAVQYGSKLKVYADGPDEEQVLDALERLVNESFHEE